MEQSLKLERTSLEVKKTIFELRFKKIISASYVGAIFGIFGRASGFYNGCSCRRKFCIGCIFGRLYNGSSYQYLCCSVKQEGQ